jgi:hypothetical protein
MPPIFENDALVTFYRPCWAAHERGPPEGQTITEVNLSHLYPLLTPFNRNSYFAQNGLFLPSPPPLLPCADSTVPARVPPSRTGIFLRTA